MRGAGVGLIVASVLGSSPAVAQDFPEPVVQWGVQPDESCEDIAQVVWGDARHAPLVMRYNAVTCTRGAPLKVGLTLILPAKVTAPAAARIRSIVPSVQARPPGGSWSAAAQGAPLDDNSGVQTLETGRASIQFLDRSQLMLSENTLVVIFGTASQSTVGSRGAPKIEIDQGEVRAMVAALRGEPLEVATPGGGSVAATSRETVIERKGDRSTVVVFEGSARVANAGATVQVAKNFGTRFTGKSAPSAPRPLPAAPAWTGPAPEVLLLAGDDDPWTTEWVPAFEAKAHRIELATDAAFASLELRQEVPGSVRRFVARRVKPGVYHLRVRSIDAEDYLGIASETRKTAIARVNVVEGSLERTPEGALVTPSTRLSVVAPPGTNVSLEDGTSIASDAPFVLAGRPAAIIVRMGGAEARLALRYPARPEVASSELAARKEEVAQAPTLVDMASPQPFAWGATPGALGGPSPLWVPRSSSWAVVSGGASTSLEAPEGAGSFRVAGLAPLGPAGLELELRSERASDAMARADLALAGWVGVRSSFLSLEDAEVWDVGAAVRAGFPMGPAALPPRVEGAAAVTAQLGAFTLVLDAGLRLVADGSGAGARGAIGFGAAFVAYEALPWLSILAGVDGASVRAAEAFLPDVGLVGGVELGAAEWFVGTVTRVSPLTSELGQVSAAVSFGARGP